MDKAKFWLSDYKVLFNNLEFFPNKNMSRNELLNSFTRYSIIIFILFFFIGSNFTWYYLPCAIIIACLVLYYLDIPRQKEEKINEAKINHICREPNINNPYMNVLVTQDSINLPACKHFNDKIKTNVDKYYKFNLYQNSDDIFDKKHLERQFYTMPVSTIPNNQKGFLNWLYKKDGNCKEDNVNCLEYEDERYH